MARIVLRAGYDFQRKFTATLDGVAEDLSAATIKACLKNVGKTATLIASTTQANTSPASWATGIVVVAFTSVQTAGLAPQDAWIEVQATIGGLKLPYEDVPVTIEAGYP